LSGKNLVGVFDFYWLIPLGLSFTFKNEGAISVLEILVGLVFLNGLDSYVGFLI